MWARAALASPLGIAVLKTAVSQAGYETASTAAYLGLQEAARGGGPRSILGEIRHKFWRAWKSGFAFFSAAHVLMFLVPVWWLQARHPPSRPRLHTRGENDPFALHVRSSQPLVDNLSCLAFNTYLALLSHEDIEDAHAEAHGRNPTDKQARIAPGAPLRISS